MKKFSGRKSVRFKSKSDLHQCTLLKLVFEVACSGFYEIYMQSLNIVLYSLFLYGFYFKKFFVSYYCFNVSFYSKRTDSTNLIFTFFNMCMLYLTMSINCALTKSTISASGGR